MKVLLTQLFILFFQLDNCEESNKTFSKIKLIHLQFKYDNKNNEKNDRKYEAINKQNNNKDQLSQHLSKSRLKM